MSARLATLRDPEDVLQEALLLAVESGKVRSITSPLEFRAWLVACARLRVLGLARDLRPRTRPQRATPLPCAQLVLCGEGLQRVVQESLPRCAQDEEARLRGSLHRLTADQRMVVVLRDYLGVSWSTAGQILGRSPSTTRKTLQRAHGRLRELDRAPGRRPAANEPRSAWDLPGDQALGSGRARRFSAIWNHSSSTPLSQGSCSLSWCFDGEGPQASAKRWSGLAVLLP